MAISPYVRELRAHIGGSRLLLPSVTAIVYDREGRILLVRQRADQVWTTPGGTIEPDETPADAVVRETWEETGLTVRPSHVLGVYGGPEFVVRYPNGDESQYVMTVFECVAEGGEPRPDGDETIEVCYWSAVETAALRVNPWLRSVLPVFFERPGSAQFTAPRWSPPRV